MVLALAAASALVGLVAACSVGSGEDVVASPPPPVVKLPPGPPPPPRSLKQYPIRVTVIDGDLRTRVAGAVVDVGGRAGRTDDQGVAAIVLRRPGAQKVTARAKGYGSLVVRHPFQRERSLTLSLYRPALQWTQYGVDYQRTQTHSAIRIRPPFRTVWSRGLGTLIEFPAVVSNGVAYIGNLKGTIYALSMRSGKYLWEYDPPGGKMASSPAIWGDALVVHGMDGIVRILDRATGKLRWSMNIGSPIESSPIVRDGVDYFGAWNGRIYALDLAKRRLRWTAAGGYKITSSASFAGKRMFIGDYGGRLLALDAGSGQILFARSVNGRVYGTPAVAGGRVFVPSSTGNSLTAFTTAGEYLWRVTTGGYVYSSPAVWGGKVFFGSYDGNLYTVSASNGSVLWRTAAGGPVSGAAVVVAGVAYAGSTWGRITGVDGRTGDVVLRFPHGKFVPVSGNGRRLLLHGYSRIWAVEPVR